MNIVQAVKLAIHTGKIDGEWKREENIGTKLSSIHGRNECFALCSGTDARTDYYEMFIPEYRKNQKKG